MSKKKWAIIGTVVGVFAALIGYGIYCAIDERKMYAGSGAAIPSDDCDEIYDEDVASES